MQADPVLVPLPTSTSIAVLPLGYCSAMRWCHPAPVGV